MAQNDKAHAEKKDVSNTGGARSKAAVNADKIISKTSFDHAKMTAGNHLTDVLAKYTKQG